MIKIKDLSMNMEEQSESIRVESNFLDRQKQLNDQLSLTEKSLNKHQNHKGSYVPRIEDLAPRTYRKDRIKGFRGKESIFKRPDAPPPRLQNKNIIPDFRINPHKYTYYNLEDVPDISDESNKKAALSFLNEMRERREKKDQKQKIQDRLQNESMDIDNDDINITHDKSLSSSCTVKFNKPLRKKEKLTNDKHKLEFRNNVIVMPEYEIGTKTVPKKKKLQKSIISEKVDKNKQMKLDHLQKYSDDDEE
ncbi:uncharacterized protein LOC131670389 [Phymastichus coffea]|uniref:uncharacterized protein LOC131670389 n=1 Tax=Phymastichus coffea TaxID=108790 RepID=UPI00273AD1EA|nr:uncharacterized protein LOC131670389 [Phymastichus coffea]